MITDADFVACHNFGFLEKMDVLGVARSGATFLLNSPYGADEVWDKIPREVQEQIVSKQLDFYIVDGHGVAEKAGLGGRINTVLQTCFFYLSGILPRDEAIAAIKKAIEKSYARFGESVLERNYAAVDGAIEAIHKVEIPASAFSDIEMRPVVPPTLPTS